jgi:plastocyanin
MQRLERTIRLSHHYRRARLPVALAGALLVACTLGGLAQSQLSISQKGREFRPGTVNVKRGDSVQIVNDDADLRHHAYVDADNFKYDSGDQEPGSKIAIAFPVTGDFEVLCAIHPKMKLEVHVK